MPPLEERTEYPYQNIRTKNYQWGNGDKVSNNCFDYDDWQLLTMLLDPLVSINLDNIWHANGQKSIYTAGPELRYDESKY